jgi:hypothetical protein
LVYVCERHLPYLPVWEFEANITSGEASRVFKSHSAMEWSEFEKEVLKQLDGMVLPVQLAYRLSGDTSKMFYLTNEADWASALKRLDAKISSARKNTVSMEVRNVVS